MESSSWAQVIVAVIAVGSAYLSYRAARSSAKLTSDATVANTRTQAETEAYNRARKMDIETIERQDKELEELNKVKRQMRVRNRLLAQDNDRLRERLASLEEDISTLRRRVAFLEEQGETHV